jgi:hypothetical protein
MSFQMFALFLLHGKRMGAWCWGNALASHRCGASGSWVVGRGFDPRLGYFSGFPPSVKINISKFQFDHGRGRQVYRFTAITCYPRKTKLIYLFTTFKPFFFIRFNCSYILKNLDYFSHVCSYFGIS